jgi:hypothetical protein
MNRLLCWLGLHPWVKRGGTRTTGLFRRCPHCGKEQEGFEDRNDYGRFITWVNRT